MHIRIPRKAGEANAFHVIYSFFAFCMKAAGRVSASEFLVVVTSLVRVSEGIGIADASVNDAVFAMGILTAAR